ncbi:hypothetical protein RvY_10028 [Ramazzottius varieornatus]|uniref:Uncharacterized protein n=1 Tax=Ramazzottius varieornatus TaxID=947166 RepID=A0A1D1VBE3_RAMVA|nr:hypothetical protein RvY_10028 [Ramazzottius varieornatus]
MEPKSVERFPRCVYEVWDLGYYVEASMTFSKKLSTRPSFWGLGLTSKRGAEMQLRDEWFPRKDRDRLRKRRLNWRDVRQMPWPGCYYNVSTARILSGCVLVIGEYQAPARVCIYPFLLHVYTRAVYLASSRKFG